MEVARCFEAGGVSKHLSAKIGTKLFTTDLYMLISHADWLRERRVFSHQPHY